MAKYLLWYLVFTLGKLPFPARSAIGRALGSLLSYLPTRDRLITSLQISNFLQSARIKETTRSVYAHFGGTFFECLNLKPLIENPVKYIDCPDFHEAERLLAQKKGIIALSAHIGNWDAMGAYFAAKNVPLLVVARKARNPAVHYVLERLRNSFGFRTLWRANNKGITQILNALDNGEVVAALIDQDTRVGSIPAPFFGKTVSTPSTLVEIGRRSGALFASAFVVRKKDGRFEIRVKEIPAQHDTAGILTEFNSRLEEIIREFPEQWAWMHKRWRTLPSGERMGGRQYLIYLQKMLEANSIS